MCTHIHVTTEAMTERPKYNWGIEAAIDVVGGKWKSLILWELRDETLRFRQLQDRVEPRITQRMLTKELRQLEADGPVTRKVYPQVPPKVEYSLTAKGRSVIPLLELLCRWGEENLSDRIRYGCDGETRS